MIFGKEALGKKTRTKLTPYRDGEMVMEITEKGIRIPKAMADKMAIGHGDFLGFCRNPEDSTQLGFYLSPNKNCVPGKTITQEKQGGEFHKSRTIQCKGFVAELCELDYETGIYTLVDTVNHQGVDCYMYKHENMMSGLDVEDPTLESNIEEVETTNFTNH